MRGRRNNGPNYISRVAKIGESLYAHLTIDVCRKLGLKHGDRLAMDAEGGVGYFSRIPLETLLGTPAIRAAVARAQEANAETPAEVAPAADAGDGSAL